MSLHPATQIVAWCLYVALLQTLSFGPLLAAALVALLIVMTVSGRKLAQLIRRTRWIMLSLLLIYAWGTPGHPVYEPLEAYSPTWEGLADGLMQLGRLLAALAGLALLLDRLHRMHLIAGLHALFAPFGWFSTGGLASLRERIAVRLALTLHYAEVAMLRGKNGWRETLGDLLAPHDDQSREMELPLFRFGFMDAALLAGCTALLVWGMMSRGYA